MCAAYILAMTTDMLYDIYRSDQARISILLLIILQKTCVVTGSPCPLSNTMHSKSEIYKLYMIEIMFTCCQTAH